MDPLDFLLPTPVERISFAGRELWLKRDDRIHPDFSGNKARKLWHWLRGDFPEVRRIVSYGSAQSNALYSLSVLARMRGWGFDYYVDHIPDRLREHPVGNYAAALANGVDFHVGEPLPEREEGILFVEEGGRQSEAEEGVRLLAEEILRWREEGIGELCLFLPSGTGTTALYLSKTFRLRGADLRVRTVSCVGDAAYLREQFALLEPDPSLWPEIVDPPQNYAFGRLRRELYEIWLKLRESTGVEFDLLYDPVGWITLLERWPEEPLLYLHQGGLLGNASMLERYRRKYPGLDRMAGRAPSKSEEFPRRRE